MQAAMARSRWRCGIDPRGPAAVAFEVELALEGIVD
jgi:hypothetical protein